MGDRTWLRIEFSKHDLDKFNEVLKDQIWDDTWWDELMEADESAMEIAEVHEANYGWYNEMELLKNAKLTFRMFHGAGGNYGSGTAVCYMGKMVEMDTSHEDQPVVTVTKDGPDSYDLEQAQEYFELSEKIDLYFKDDFRSHVMRACNGVKSIKEKPNGEKR